MDSYFLMLAVLFLGYGSITLMIGVYPYGEENITLYRGRKARVISLITIAAGVFFLILHLFLPDELLVLRQPEHRPRIELVGTRIEAGVGGKNPSSIFNRPDEIRAEWL